MKVQIGFDLAANGIGDWFTLNDATKGVLDNVTYLLAGDSLVDVTSDVRAVQVRRGRSRTLDKFTAGNANITLDNRDRAFDPTFAPTIGGTRVNLAPNPNFEVDLTGWQSAIRCTVARTTAKSWSGFSSMLFTASGGGNGVVEMIPASSAAVTAGTVYTASMYVLRGSGVSTGQLIIRWQTAANADISASASSSTTISTSAWTRLTVTGTAPVTAAFAKVQFEGTGTVVAGDTFYIDGVMVEAAASAGAYFDGSFADSSILVNSQSWNGTSNASASTLVWNSVAGSPYYGSIVPRKQVVISHNDVPIYSGSSEDWNFGYTLNGDSTAEVSCVDGFSILASTTRTGGTATAQATGARVGAVLDEIGWPTTLRSISTGQATLDADVVPPTDNVLAYLQKVEVSEPGALFIGKTGALTFRDRADLQAFTSGVTFGTGGIPFTEIGVVYGTEEMTNTANVIYSAGSAVGGTATATDATAIASYGVMEQTYDTLLANSTDASSLATWIVGLYSQPQYRIDSIGVNLAGITSAQVNQVLALELGDTVLVTWTPNNAGSAISQYVSIDGIEHSATPASHVVRFTMSESTAAFLLDSSAFGVLDQNILGF